jgi:pyruvate/2-oxoglutarate dehydrogenase complex dihydrolipoamide dehydrogenase (E3) component
MGSQIVTVEVPRLKKLGVKIVTSTHIKRIDGHRVTLYDVDTKDETVQEVEAIVMATGRRADPTLFKQLESAAEQVFAIGDALSPRGLTSAIQEGHRYARVIGEPGAPRDFTEYYFEPVDFSLFQKPASTLLADQRPFEPARA